MEHIKKKLELPKQSYYETHLSIINCILPNTKIKLSNNKEVNLRLTPMEIQVLASFMGLEGDIALHRFGPSAKKIVMTQLEITAAGLSNYMTVLTDKGFLKKVGDMTTILPLLIPEMNEQLYTFRLIKANETT